ncbi:MAG: phytanoyl-CoA dioxygenase family protein [Chitinophagales bacterium]
MNIFKDPILQHQFNRDGYVKIPFTSIHNITLLSALYKDIQPQSYKGFSSTIYNQNIALKQTASRQIADILNPSVTNLFHHFRPLGCSFLCKAPGPESYLPVHQDWTLVDESKYFSATIWIPLVETNERNGVLKVLPGSHRFSSTLRSPTLPGSFEYVTSGIYEKMQSVPVQPGEAVVINHALLHASPANFSATDRVVATFGLVPEQAALFFYHRTSNGKVEKYEVPDNFFLTYNRIGEAPEFGKKTEEFTYHWRVWNIQEVNTAINHYRQILKSEKMRPLFTDNSVQEFYNQYGYAKFRILDEPEVKILYDYYYEQGLNEQAGTGFSMSMENADKEKVARIREKIYEVALPKAMNHFGHGKVIAGSYVVKNQDPLCIVPPHQDWSFADNEGEYYSVTCWIPLVDTTLENGAMGVIQGSHVMLNNVRSSPSPQVPTPLMEHQFTIFPYLKMIEMKAGEALVFDHRTFHASTPNVTTQSRIAIGLGFTQKDATICHYTMKLNGKKDTLLKYYVDDAFLLKYDNSLLAKMYDRGESIQGYDVAEEIPFEFNPPSLEHLVEMVTLAGNPLNTELSNYMAKLFGYNTLELETTVVATEPSTQTTTEATAPAKPYKGAYTPMNILREIKLRLLGR